MYNAAMNMWRYKRFHVSYCVLLLGCGSLAGLALALYLHITFAWIWLAVLALVLVWAMWSRRWFACLVVLAVGVVLGLFRGSVYDSALERTARYADQNVVVSGVVHDDPTTEETASLWTVRLTNIRLDQRRFTGDMYATVVSDTPLRRGDTLVLSGKARSGFGSFVLTMRRATVLQRTASTDLFLQMRDAFTTAVRRVMPEPEASLGVGFLIGQKSALPDDLSDDMRTVGLTHIVVASGYNLTILVRFARRLLAKTSRYLALVGSSLVVMGFVAVSGASPSMTRAAVVTLLSLLAWYVGRKFHPVQLIVLVAAGSALVQPTYLWSDIGWWLSFSAFFGVLVVSPLAVRAFARNQKQPNATVQLVVEAVAALAMTLPISVAVFGYVPVLSLLANLLVVPTIPFAMAAVFVAGAVGLIAPVAALVAAPASLLTAYVVRVVHTLAAVPWARFDTTVSIAVVVGWYVLLGGCLVAVWRRHRVDMRQLSVVE